MESEKYLTITTGGLNGQSHRGMGKKSLSTSSSPYYEGGPSLTAATLARQNPPAGRRRSSDKTRSLNKSKSIGNVLGHLFNKSKSISNVDVYVQDERSFTKSDSFAGESLKKNKSLSIGNVQGGQPPSKSSKRHSLNKSKSIGNVQVGQNMLNKSKTLGGGSGNASRSHYKLSVDGRVPLPGFGRVSSAGACGLRERPSSSSPHPFSFSSLQPSPLFLSQCSLNSQASQSSITSQVLDIAENMGVSASLPYLVEDAKKLHKKLMALVDELDFGEVGTSDEVESVGSEGIEERVSRQAWRDKSTSPFESDTPRPSVGALVDELTEVEQQIRGGRTESVSTNEGAPGAKRNITASTATLELDELMQNLSKFEATNHGQGADGMGKDSAQKGKSAMDDLSSMLTSLDQDMTGKGINTVAKGICGACNKPILNKVVKALGKQWHPEHFTCACCDIELGSTTYYESNGRPYCEKDYNELYAPRCAYCNGPILDRVMRALDRTWHPEHFFCSLCGKHFGTEGFHQKDGKAFCRECYYEKFAPRCRRCDKAIMEGFITAINAQWHPECFSCKICGVTFPRGNYFEHEGEPHCEIHYHASRGTLCNSCQKPVTGKCITAMGKKWHPEHFNCAFCLKLLNKGTFKEHRQNPYCHPCYIKLFG